MKYMEIELDKHELVHKKVPVVVGRVLGAADVVKSRGSVVLMLCQLY